MRLSLLIIFFLVIACNQDDGIAVVVDSGNIPSGATSKPYEENPDLVLVTQQNG